MVPQVLVANKINLGPNYVVHMKKIPSWELQLLLPQKSFYNLDSPDKIHEDLHKSEATPGYHLLQEWTNGEPKSFLVDHPDADRNPIFIPLYYGILNRDLFVQIIRDPILPSKQF